MCPISENHKTVIDELDRWRDAGGTADVWLRDDDAHEPGPALDALLERSRAHGAPCLLAVVPMLADGRLADRLRGEGAVRVAMHGVRHANHAAPGGKKAETPLERGIDVIVPELEGARRRIIGLFGPEAGEWYVPPWNRIDREVAGKLVDLGFRAVSTFAGRPLGLEPPFLQIDTHVDIIDWRNGRIGRSVPDVLDAFAAELALARRHGWRPVGVLTHHLVHDAAAWSALDALLDLVSGHPAARWRRPDDLLVDAAAAG
jgi:hypothetical protein